MTLNAFFTGSNWGVVSRKGTNLMKNLIANRHVQDGALVVFGMGGVAFWLLMLKLGAHF